MMRLRLTLLLALFSASTVAAGDAPPREDATLVRRNRDSLFKDDVLLTEAVAFSPDGSLLAVCGEQEIGRRSRARVALLDPRTLKVLRFFDGELGPPTGSRQALTVAVTADNRFVAAGVREDLSSRDLDPTSRVKVWDAASGDLVADFPSGFLLGTKGIASSPREALLAYFRPDGTIALWEPNARRERAALPARKPLDTVVINLAFSPDGRSLAALQMGDSLVPGPEANMRFLLKVWRLGEDREYVSTSMKNRRIEGLAFSSDGSSLITAEIADDVPLSPEAVFIIHDAATLKERRRLMSGRRYSHFPALAVSPDGSLLVTSDTDSQSDRLCLWDLAEGRLLCRLKGEETMARSLAFSPDGKTVATVDLRNSYLWDVKKGKP